MWCRRVAAPVGLFSMKSSLLWLLLKRENCLFSYQIAHSQRNHAHTHMLSSAAVYVVWLCLSKLWSCECCAPLACLREPTQDSAQTPTHWHLHPSWHKHTHVHTGRPPVNPTFTSQTLINKSLLSPASPASVYITEICMPPLLTFKGGCQAIAGAFTHQVTY